MRAVGGGAMFMPRNMQEVVDFATIMSKAGPALPPAWRGNPGLCLATTMQSLRWEMDPFAVAGKSYVTKDKGGNERIAYEAQLIAAVINTRAPITGRLRVEYEGDGTSRRCITFATFKGDNKPTILKTPPISQITVKNSPLWTSDPDQQLAYYAQRAWGRRHCPEVLMGVYTPDEVAGMEGYDAQDITPLPPRGQSIAAAAAQLGAPAPPPAQQHPPHDPETGEIIEDGSTKFAIDALVTDELATEKDALAQCVSTSTVDRLEDVVGATFAEQPELLQEWSNACDARRQELMAPKGRK